MGEARERLWGVPRVFFNEDLSQTFKVWGSLSLPLERERNHG